MKKRNPRLTPSERDVLEEMVASRPGLSCLQLARIFEKKTGRRIERGTVFKLRKRGGVYPPPSLGKAERATLEALIVEARGSLPCRVLAERFEEATGRPIRPGKVWHVAVHELGIRCRRGDHW